MSTRKRTTATLSDDKHSLRQAFIAAANAVEKETLGLLDNEGRAVEKEGDKDSHANADRLFLDRLRNKENSHVVSEALEIIARQRKNADDNKRADDYKGLIKAILVARLASVSPKKLSKIYNQDIETHKELKRCADTLHKFFSDEIYRDPESLIRFAPKAGGLVDLPTEEWPTDSETLTDLLTEWPSDYKRRQAMRSLEWMQQIIKKRLDMLSKVEFSPGRKLKTASSVLFMSALCRAMIEIFGQPLYEAVARLTDVALAMKEITTSDRARSAHRRAMHRAVHSRP
jgi:hypothetical protein